MNVDRSPMRNSGLPALLARLDEHNIDALVIADEKDLDSLTAIDMPHVGILDLSTMRRSLVQALLDKCAGLKLPTIALVPPERVLDLDAYTGITDFALNPPNPDELVARAKRIVLSSAPTEGDDVIHVGELIINPTTYDVSLRGKRVNLRFKEYELLRLLAANPGRVYTREALLSQVWGYDYLGGTRTVDVHVRRLRSKIEDADNLFIETIWNVGYRFRDPNA